MVDQDCIFCKIANGEIPSATIFEDQFFRVILDVNPASKGHALILPKEHFEDITKIDETIASKVMPLAAKIVIAIKEVFHCDGVNLVQNNGVEAGQTVFHFHMHIIPRYSGEPRIISWDSHKEESDILISIADMVKRVM